MAQFSRRQFLEDSMLAAAAAMAAGSATRVFAQEQPQAKGANEKLIVACVGVKGQGKSHVNYYSDPKNNTEIAYIVDVDEAVGKAQAAAAAKKQGREPKWVADIREVLNDKSVDAISTATPNHWHSLIAIWAMQAGKDIYVEKPLSHNVSEGRRAVEAARKYNRICQVGTQARSAKAMQDAVEYMNSGKIGDVKLARALCYKTRNSIGAKGTYEVPATVNYDLWSGPAQIKPLTRPNLHYDWHWMWDYGNGDLGNQGIHQMDVARWGLGVNELSRGVLSYGGRLGYEDAGETANTQVVIHDYGDKTLVFEVRGLKTDGLKGAKIGVIFEGTDGYVVLTDRYSSGAAFDKNGNAVQKFEGGGNHHSNFVKAVKSRKHEDLNADVLDGHLSSALCHLGNASYRLGSDKQAGEVAEALGSHKGSAEAQETLERTLEHLNANNVDLAKTKIRLGQDLKFDPKAEKFVSNSEADTMLTREYRAPFVVPAAGKV